MHGRAGSQETEQESAERIPRLSCRDRCVLRPGRHQGQQARRRHLPAENAEVTDLRRWFAEAIDIRDDTQVAEDVLAFIEAAGARSIVMADRIVGCPHEEGIDYEGSTCPHWPFWAGRNRRTGQRVH